MSLDQSLDVVFILDPFGIDEPRLSLFRCEIAAALTSGLRCGLLALWNATGTEGLRFDKWIRERLESGELAWVRASGRARCRVAVILDADAFRHLPAIPRPLIPEGVWVAPPVRPSSSEAQRARAIRNISSYFHASALIHSLAGTTALRGYVPLLRQTEISHAPRAAPVGAGIMGLDGTSPGAVPDDLAAALEQALDRVPNLVLRSWGPAEGLREGVLADPRCMRSEASAETAAAFFPALDFHVAGPEAQDGAAALMPVLLALAKGAAVMAPASLEPLLGEGAIYLDWGELPATIARLMSDPAAYSRQSRAALRIARKRFDAGLWLPRFEHYLNATGNRDHSGPPKTQAARVLQGARDNVLMISSNGVGLGHVTRLLAVARRLPDRLQPRFLTLSEGVGLITAQGYGADYIPSLARQDLDHESWNLLLARRIARFIQIYAPRAALFDGNHPYSGLLDVISATPEVAWFWIRRPLWKRGRDLEALERWRNFDAVIEPQDLCANEDVGPTTTERNRVIEVPPPLLLTADERLSRESARRELGLGEGGTCVAIQLGSGSNFDFSAIRAAMLSDLRRRPGLRLFELHSPITHPLLRAPEDGVQPLEIYPSARVSAAFDLLISSAGYNSFHECLCCGVPAVFVPNESHEMDDQMLRARFAESIGSALTLRANETWRVGEALDMALGETFRTRARQRAIVVEDGAAEIARIIDEATSALRTGRSLSDGINRI